MSISKHNRKSGAVTVKKDGKIVGNIGKGKKGIDNLVDVPHGHMVSLPDHKVPIIPHEITKEFNSSLDKKNKSLKDKIFEEFLKLWKKQTEETDNISKMAEISPLNTIKLCTLESPTIMLKNIDFLNDNQSGGNKGDSSEQILAWSAIVEMGTGGDNYGGKVESVICYTETDTKRDENGRKVLDEKGKRILIPGDGLKYVFDSNTVEIVVKNIKTGEEISRIPTYKVKRAFDNMSRNDLSEDELKELKEVYEQLNLRKLKGSSMIKPDLEIGVVDSRGNHKILRASVKSDLGNSATLTNDRNDLRTQHIINGCRCNAYQKTGLCEHWDKVKSGEKLSTADIELLELGEGHHIGRRATGNHIGKPGEKMMYLGVREHKPDATLDEVRKSNVVYNEITSRFPRESVQKTIKRVSKKKGDRFGNVTKLSIIQDMYRSTSGVGEDANCVITLERNGEIILHSDPVQYLRNNLPNMRTERNSNSELYYRATYDKDTNSYTIPRARRIRMR